MNAGAARSVSRRDALAGGAAVGLSALALPAAAAASSGSVGGQGGGSGSFDWVIRRTQETAATYRSIVYGDAKFVTVRTGGSMTSADGASWTEYTDSDADGREWYGLAYGSWGDGPTKRFVAVGDGGDATGRVMTSADGVSWSIGTTLDTPTRWEDVAFGVVSNLPVFVAVGSPDGTGTTTDHVMVSQDGVTWAQPTTRITAANLRAVAAGTANYATLFVAVGDAGAVYTSTDGLSWSSRTGAVQDANWKSVTYGAGIFVAVGDAGAVMTSVDGVAWTPRSMPNRNWSDVAFGDDQFVAVAVSGTGSRSVWSVLGETWTYLTTPADSTWSSIAHGSGRFVAVSPTAGIHVMSYDVPMAEGGW